MMGTQYHKLANALVLAIVVAILYWAFLSIPMPVATDNDFRQLYGDLVGILGGSRIYDEAAHGKAFAAALGRSEPVPMNPAAYPPWYYLIFLPLGLLSLDAAARTWAFLNFFMLVNAAAIPVLRASFRIRAAALVGVVCFGPVIGHIVIGQQTAMIVLGLALASLGLDRRSPLVGGIGFTLLTLKPHLGLPILLGLWWWAALKRRDVLFKTTSAFLSLLAVLIVASLAVDSRALADYPAALSRFTGLPENRLCDTCSSLSLFLQSRLSEGSVSGWTNRFLSGVVVGALLVIPLVKRARTVDAAFAFGAALASWLLLSSMYVRNYDYVLLVTPLVFSMYAGTRSKHPVIVICSMLTYVLIEITTLGLPRGAQGELLWTSALASYALVLLTMSGSLAGKKNGAHCYVSSDASAASTHRQNDE
jgi:hypothetical protein